VPHIYAELQALWRAWSQVAVPLYTGQGHAALLRRLFACYGWSSGAVARVTGGVPGL